MKRLGKRKSLPLALLVPVLMYSTAQVLALWSVMLLNEMKKNPGIEARELAAPAWEETVEWYKEAIARVD